MNRFYTKPVSPPTDQNCRSAETPGSPSTSVPTATLSEAQSSVDQAVSQSSAESPIPWQTDETPPAQLPDCAVAGAAHELFSWELGQKYFFDPTFGGALVNGFRNVFTSTVDFTAIAFLTSPRHFSPLISRFRINPLGRLGFNWDLDYDFNLRKINSSLLSVSYRIGSLTLAAGDAYLQAPGGTVSSNNIASPTLFNNVRFGATYGTPLKRGFSAAGIGGYDANKSLLQYTAVQSSYNWDCCGISVEYRRWFLPNIRNENEYRFIFNLANVGTFGNLRRRERLY